MRDSKNCMRFDISDAAATRATSAAVVVIMGDRPAVDVSVATAVEGQSEGEGTEVDGLRSGGARGEDSGAEGVAESVVATEDRRCRVGEALQECETA